MLIASSTVASEDVSEELKAFSSSWVDEISIGCYFIVKVSSREKKNVKNLLLLILPKKERNWMKGKLETNQTAVLHLIQYMRRVKRSK